VVDAPVGETAAEAAQEELGGDMPVAHVNPGEFHGSHGWWRPTGKLTPVPHPGVRKNPVDITKPALISARLFIGMNVGGKPKWKVKDIVTRVAKALRSVGLPPDSSYLSQVGVWSSIETGKMEQEKSVQVILLNFKEPSLRKWTEKVGDVAESVRVALSQEAVYGEVQKNGVTTAQVVAHS